MIPASACTSADASGSHVHYPASDGYLAYDYRHDPQGRENTLALPGSGETADCHVMLPPGVVSAKAVTGDTGAAVAFTASRVESSAYADFTPPLLRPTTVRVSY